MLPFAHLGVPVMLIITRIPYSPDWNTRSSRLLRPYAGSSPFAGFAGLVDAIVAQLTFVWMTEAPVAAASWRFWARSAEYRNDTSSKKPIGMRLAAAAVAAGSAKSATSAASRKRPGLFTGRSSFSKPATAAP